MSPWKISDLAGDRKIGTLSDINPFDNAKKLRGTLLAV